jgi:hypothetical protein
VNGTASVIPPNISPAISYRCDDVLTNDKDIVHVMLKLGNIRSRQYERPLGGFVFVCVFNLDASGIECLPL